MEFTLEELQLMYNALMAYGNEVSDCAKKFPNEEFADVMSNKAKAAWQLAREITEIME